MPCTSNITYSSPRKNSAVNARCSRDELAESTPPYNSLSRTVPNAVLFAVLYTKELFDQSPDKITASSSDLESKVFERMGNTRFALISTSSLDKECHG